jgi:hypothetical protein
LRLYGREASRALRHAARAWPVAFSLVLYGALMQLVTAVVAPLGMLGGFLIGFAAAACLSSYLHLLSQAVAGRPFTFADLKESFGARFWDVVSVLFAFWVINFVLAALTRSMGDRGAILRTLAGLAMAVFFNPVPELLYRGSSRSFALLGEAARFISKHGIEWLLPNLVIAAALLAPTGVLRGSQMGERVLLLQSMFTVDGVARLVASVPIWFMPFVLIVIHWAMVFRGLLFAQLVSGGARRRDLGDMWRR